MSTYVPRSSVHVPRPQERLTTEDEDRILQFLDVGIRANIDKIEEARGQHRYARAHEAQLAADLLKTLGDAIRAGLHDLCHPVRAVDPSAEARLHLAGVGR